jgi:purine-binding chemotaxis protein CheW
MDHDSDDARHELDTDATPLPDLASAFFTALDGDGELPQPPAEVRLGAALDLIAAIDASMIPASPAAPTAPPAIATGSAEQVIEPFEPFALLPATIDDVAPLTGEAYADSDEGLAGTSHDESDAGDGFGAMTPVAEGEDFLPGFEAAVYHDFLAELDATSADREAVAAPGADFSFDESPFEEPATVPITAEQLAAAAAFGDASAIAEPDIAEPDIADLEIEEPALVEMATEEAAVEESLVDDMSADAPLDLEEFIVFSLADTRCVVPIRNVVEVGRIPDAAPVPNAPAWLHGLGNLRGQVLSLIDLRAFLGLGRIRPSAGRMIVLRADAAEVVAGLMVDQVHQIVSLSPSRFQTAPATLPPGFGGFVWGVCDYGTHTMVGLDVDSVLGAEVEQAETTVLTV